MSKVFELRVELLDVEPPIWRRVLVPEDISLIDLNSVLQGAMGWLACHLSAFEIGDLRYDMTFRNHNLGEIAGLSMKGVVMRDVVRRGDSFGFQYDFGDDWWHEIEVVDHREAAGGDKLPSCIEGARACPPEDSGGPYGYAEKLEIVADRKHPEHREIKGWLGNFDPEKFDLARANREISKILKLYRELT